MSFQDWAACRPPPLRPNPTLRPGTGTERLECVQFPEERALALPEFPAGSTLPFESEFLALSVDVTMHDKCLTIRLPTAAWTQIVAQTDDRLLCQTFATYAQAMCCNFSSFQRECGLDVWTPSQPTMYTSPDFMMDPGQEYTKMQNFVAHCLDRFTLCKERGHTVPTRMCESIKLQQGIMDRLRKRHNLD